MIKNLSQYTKEKIPDINEVFSRSTQDMRVLVKIILTNTNKAWYVVESDSHGQCFGFIAGKRIDPGYFSLHQLNALETKRNKIQVDTKFEPVTINKLLVAFWYEVWGL